MSDKSKSKLSLIGLSLMIFTSVYGFNNIPRAFYKMGYAAIPWYIIAGLFYFLPFAFMITEMGSAFKNEKGGIYSWMEKATNPTYALIGTFMWYASYIIWMVNTSSNIMVPIMTLLTGDSTYTSKLAPWLLSLIAILWMLAINFVSSKGLKFIAKFTSIGGIAVLALNGLLLIGALLVLMKNGHPATAISLEAFYQTPAPDSLGTAGMLGAVSFMVYAVFAYGGVEVAGGLVDETENAEKNFPKGIVISALVIALGYSLMILMVGMFMDYSVDGQFMKDILSSKVNLGTLSYYTIQQLGTFLVGPVLGDIFARLMGLAMTLSMMGAFFTLSYSPIKQILAGTPKKLWPKRYSEFDTKTGMPLFAMKVQLVIAIFFIVLNVMLNLLGGAQGAKASEVFFAVLTNMTNVAMTLPYVMIIFAFIRFKFNDKIEKPFVIMTKPLAVCLAILAIVVVGFANLFTIIQPIFQPEIAAPLPPIISTISMMAGPVLFTLIALYLIYKYKKKYPEEYQKLNKID
ncbi:MAG: glutamate/gamma-aminobutyrate family transporter YjeM [Lactovum sp.]